VRPFWQWSVLLGDEDSVCDTTFTIARSFLTTTIANVVSLHSKASFLLRRRDTYRTLVPR
jgi:hypothetical protein